MTENNSNNSKDSSSGESSIFSTVQNYVTSKRMLYLVAAVVLCVAIYFYMNRGKKDVIVKEEQKEEQQKDPEIIFSQELVQNLYRNNSNPIQYLMMLQQQGQIPNGPLPKIVLDYNIEQQVPQQQVLQQQQVPQQQVLQQQQVPQQQVLQQNQLPRIDERGEESEIIDEINYENEVKTANSVINTQYQQIEDDDVEDDLINQKLTKAEIERINKKILSK